MAAQARRSGHRACRISDIIVKKTGPALEGILKTELA